MANINCSVYTPRGEFFGKCNAVEGTVEECNNVMQILQSEINNMNFFVIYNGQGGEITIPGSLCKESVFVFSVV